MCRNRTKTFHTSALFTQYIKPVTRSNVEQNILFPYALCNKHLFLLNVVVFYLVHIDTLSRNYSAACRTAIGLNTQVDVGIRSLIICTFVNNYRIWPMFKSLYCTILKSNLQWIIFVNLPKSRIHLEICEVKKGGKLRNTIFHWEIDMHG